MGMKKVLFGLAIVVLLSGCIHEPMGVHLVGAPPGPPPNPTKVAACKKTRFWHNFWVLSGSLFGGAAGASGGASAISDNQNVKTGVAIGAAGAGVMAAVATTAAGIEADEYTTDNCQQILQEDANASAAP